MDQSTIRWHVPDDLGSDSLELCRPRRLPNSRSADEEGVGLTRKSNDLRIGQRIQLLQERICDPLSENQLFNLRKAPNRHAYPFQALNRRVGRRNLCADAKVVQNHDVRRVEEVPLIGVLGVGDGSKAEGQWNLRCALHTARPRSLRGKKRWNEKGEHCCDHEQNTVSIFVHRRHPESFYKEGPIALRSSVSQPPERVSVSWESVQIEPTMRPTK